MVLGTLISHPELLNRDTLYELRGIVARYPYFQTARLLRLNNMYLLHDPDFGAELKRSVLYVSDRRILYRLIEGYADRVVPDEPKVATEELSVDRTMDLINAFLGTLPEEMGSNTLLTPNEVGDYASRFLQGEDVVATPLVKTEELDCASSDSVLRALQLMSEKEDSTAPVIAAETSDVEMLVVDNESLDESYFTETLAKIYIKQRKYSRALEIIRSLY